MEEIYEFRVVEEYASRIFLSSEGQRLGSGSIRKVLVRSDDPRLSRIAALQAELTGQNKPFFFGWKIHRRYTQRELDAADLFYIYPARRFEPEGEACGTVYDDAQACPECGSGAPRVGPLIIDTRRVPKRVEFAGSIASELVISCRVAALFRREDVVGLEADRLFSPGAPLRESGEWCDPRVNHVSTQIVAPTMIADEPFAPADGACSRGDLLGLALISEVSVAASTRGTDDVILTRHFVGVRRGVLRPRRLMLVSQKVRTLLVREKLTGFEVEIAHLVS